MEKCVFTYLRFDIGVRAGNQQYLRRLAVPTHARAVQWGPPGVGRARLGVRPGAKQHVGNLPVARLRSQVQRGGARLHTRIADATDA